MGACGRVWRHVAGCGGRVGACYRGKGYVGGHAHGMDGDIW